MVVWKEAEEGKPEAVLPSQYHNTMCTQVQAVVACVLGAPSLLDM